MQLTGSKRIPLIFEASALNIDDQILNDRLNELDARKTQSIKAKKEEALRKEVMAFMHHIRPGKDLTCCTLQDIKRFSVWKNQHVQS